MQIEATTSQAALTGSPRVSATTANATAPATATADQTSFSRSVIIVSREIALAFRLVGQQPFCGPASQQNIARPGRKAPERNAPSEGNSRWRAPLPTSGRRCRENRERVSFLLLLAAVEKEQNEDDDPVDDVAPVVGHVHRQQDADQRDQCDRPRRRAEIVAAAAQHIDAADDDGGDRLEEIRGPHSERRLTAEADQENACERRENPLST